MKPFLALGDIAAISASGLLTVGTDWLLGLTLSAAMTFVVCNRADLHRSRLEFAVLEELPAYLLAASVATATFVCVAALREESLPPLSTLALFTVMSVGLLGCSRLATYAAAHVLRRRGHIAHPVLVVGAGHVGRQIVRSLLEHPEYGLKPLGFADDDREPGQGPLPLSVLGEHHSVMEVLTDLDVNDVIFAFARPPDAAMVGIVRDCVRSDRQVFVVPRFFELTGADRRRRIEQIRGIPIVRLRRWALRPSMALLKRATDLVLASVALIVLAPILVLCAMAVRLETGPGVIFRQERVGRVGRAFTLLKFRSYRPTREAEADQRWSVEGDSRIGPVGRFIRRTGIDELPQLINVLRGDMSLVGPRPERPHFAGKFRKRVHGYAERHRIASGLTGWAQINGLRGDTSIEERVAFDNYYIENWTMWGDVKIMVRTVRTVFRRESRSAFVTSSQSALMATSGQEPRYTLARSNSLPPK